MFQSHAEYRRVRKKYPSVGGAKQVHASHLSRPWKRCTGKWAEAFCFSRVLHLQLKLWRTLNTSAGWQVCLVWGSIRLFLQLHWRLTLMFKTYPHLLPESCQICWHPPRPRWRPTEGEEGCTDLQSLDAAACSDERLLLVHCISICWAIRREIRLEAAWCIFIKVTTYHPAEKLPTCRKSQMFGGSFVCGAGRYLQGRGGTAWVKVCRHLRGNSGIHEMWWRREDGALLLLLQSWRMSSMVEMINWWYSASVVQRFERKSYGLCPIELNPSEYFNQIYLCVVTLTCPLAGKSNKSRQNK